MTFRQNGSENKLEMLPNEDNSAVVICCTDECCVSFNPVQCRKIAAALVRLADETSPASGETEPAEPEREGAK